MAIESPAYPTRTLAARAASKAGLAAFRCKQVGKGDGHYWLYTAEPDSHGLAYARLVATGLDYVSHVEAPNTLIVTCTPDDVDDEIKADDLLTVEPVTPSMLDADSTRRKRTAREHFESRATHYNICYIPGYDAPLVNPITGAPL